MSKTHFLNFIFSNLGPRISGSCRAVSSTRNSLTFSWQSATSARSYRLVGAGVDQSSSQNMITVANLRPGSRYTFTVWAVGQSAEVVSNNITCVSNTGTSPVATVIISASRCVMLISCVAATGMLFSLYPYLRCSCSLCRNE